MIGGLRKVYNAPNCLPIPFLLLNSNVKDKVSSRIVKEDATPVSTAHDVFILVSCPVGVPVEDGHLKTCGTVRRKINHSMRMISEPLSRQYRSSASSGVSSSTVGPRERAHRQEVYKEVSNRCHVGNLSEYKHTVCSQ